MTTIEQNLARVRADLRAAVQRDLRRRARRRRLARAGLVPAFVLATAGAAMAIVPTLGDPAPERLKADLEQKDSLRQAMTPPVPRHRESPEGDRLTLVARGPDQLLYGSVEPSGAWCAVESTLDGVALGWVCHRAAVAGGPDDVTFISLGGGSTRAQNVVSGRVGDPSARTVRISAPGMEPVVADVGDLGFFIAQLPDSTLGAQTPPTPSAEALDAEGNVVATGGTPSVSRP
jgi:hypothetical protein